MSREKLLLVLAGALIAIVLLVPLGALAFIKSGIYDTGASSPHTKLTTWITHETMIHSVRRHSARVEAPRAFTAAQVAAGFCRYQAHCVACHGASGVARQQWVSGLEPAPPYLLDVRKDFTRPQLFWTVKNGIKMTGMPAWRNSMRDEEIWDVVAFLDAMPKMDSEQYRSWRSAGLCSARGPRIRSTGL